MLKLISNILFTLTTFVFLVSCSTYDSRPQERHILVPVQIQNYVSSLGIKLEKKSKKLDIIYNVYDFNVVQASTIIGSSIDISVGLIFVMENEAQLAGVLSHEIGHNVLHKDRNDKGIINLVLDSYDFPYSDRLRKYFKNYWSKKREREADIFAVNLLIQLGYNPYEYMRLFEKLIELDKSSALSKFRLLEGSHDNLKTRRIFIKSYLEKQKVRDEGLTNDTGYLLNTLSFFEDLEVSDKDLTASYFELEHWYGELRSKQQILAEDYEVGLVLLTDLIDDYDLWNYFEDKKLFFMQEVIFVSEPFIGVGRGKALYLLKKVIKYLRSRKKSPVGDVKKQKPAKSPKKFLKVTNLPQAPKIPKHYVKTPAKREGGWVYRKKETTGNAETIRVMPPTKDYPNGYWVKYNAKGEKINIKTGKHSTNKGEIHIPLPKGYYGK